MKQFKKLFVSFVLIICAVFLCACTGGGNPPKAQIDTLASVNTTGTYIEATKDELMPYITSGEASYIGDTATGYHMSQDYTAAGQSIMNANYFFKVAEGSVTEMARKMSMDISAGGMTMSYNTLEYLRNNTYYNKAGDIKYYLNNEDTNWNDVIGSDLEFDFEMIINENVGLMLENANLTVTKAVEGTTTKFKAVATTETLDEYDYDQDGDTTEVISSETETFFLVIKNGNFDGLKYIYEYTEEGVTEKIDINMVAFTGNIEFPSSFTGYVPYDPDLHGSSLLG